MKCKSKIVLDSASVIKNYLQLFKNINEASYFSKMLVSKIFLVKDEN